MIYFLKCEVSEIDARDSGEYRAVALLPGSGGLRTNGRAVSPSGLKPNSQEQAKPS